MSLQRLGLSLGVVDASQTFYKSTHQSIEFDDQGQPLPLDALVNPEAKRKCIGDTFMKVAETEVRRLNLKVDEVFLAQGTLRPDLIESASHLASSGADAIKTHHNDTQLVRDLRALGRVIEPLKDYHKDEVRALGKQLGLPDDLIHRQPFPGTNNVREKPSGLGEEG